jgi:hypothetical protein
LLAGNHPCLLPDPFQASPIIGADGRSAANR